MKNRLKIKVIMVWIILWANHVGPSTSVDKGTFFVLVPLTLEFCSVCSSLLVPLAGFLSFLFLFQVFGEFDGDRFGYLSFCSGLFLKYDSLSQKRGKEVELAQIVTIVLYI